MAISVQYSESNKAFLLLDDRFDFTYVNDFRVCYEGIDTSSHKTVVIDFSKTTAMDSSALGMLINCKKFYQSTGVNVVITSCNPQIKKIFDISSFEKLFQFV